MTALQLHGANQISVRRTMDDPGAEIPDHLLGFLTRHGQFARGRCIELNEHLTTERS